MSAASLRAFRAPDTDLSLDQHRSNSLEESFPKCGQVVPGDFGRCAAPRGALTEHEAKMTRVIAALWKAFPEATSEHDLAERAAPYFRDRLGAAISPRTVRLWLQGTSLPRRGGRHDGQDGK